MLRTLYIGLRYGTYLRSEHGINAMAEVLVSRLVGDMVKEAGPVNLGNANLRNERSHLLISAKRSGVPSIPASADMGALRSRLLIGMVTLASIAASAFLLYFTTLIGYLNQGTEPDLSSMLTAGLLAAALAGSGVYVCERMVEAARTPGTLHVQSEALVRLVVWTVLLVAIQVVVFTVMMGGEEMLRAPSGATLRYGGAFAGLLLPVLGGFLLAEVVRTGPEFRSIRMRRRIEDRLTEIDAMLERNGETWGAATRALAVNYWEQLQTFKLHKGVYDARRGHSEGTPKRFATSFAAFEREAERRFRQEPVKKKFEPFVQSGDGLSGSNLSPYPVVTRPAKFHTTVGAEIPVVIPAL